jgi:hypothetical protein
LGFRPETILAAPEISATKKPQPEKSTMNDELKPLGTIRGGRSKKPFKFFWSPKDHHVYVEQSGFFSSSKAKTGMMASSWEMAYHAAEAHVYQR